jgi:hypothetical protein
MKIKLQRVHYMPKELRPGLLYVSDQFGTAAHLCVCGCGCKIRTPLGPTEWALTETRRGPTLHPSVGNWQQACQSHYVISEGQIIWAGKLTPAEIAAGRRSEDYHRRSYYDAIHSQHGGRLRRLWAWAKDFFNS